MLDTEVQPKNFLQQAKRVLDNLNKIKLNNFCFLMELLNLLLLVNR